MMKTQKIKEIGDNPGEWLFNQKINFELGVTSVEKLPENEKKDPGETKTY